MHLDAFSVLTFDCYGTLIDWERGLWATLEPIFAASGVRVDRDEALALFAALEADAERGPYVPYREVLGRVLDGMGARLGFTPTSNARARFAGSVGAWPPFPDSPEALRALKSRYRLAILSNVDDDLFAASARALGVEFDWVFTAQQIGSYKPALRNFEHVLARTGVPATEVLHVAQSLFHDIAPARAIGLRTVWVNRRHGQPGSGATPPADAVPDVEVRSLAELATLTGAYR